MLKDITLGQYYQTESVLHARDPRVKIVGTFLFIISLFVADSWFCYLLATLFLLAMISLSGVPVQFILRGMKAVFALLLITALFNLFLTPGTPVVSLGFLRITRQGLRTAVMMVVRLSFLVFGSSLMTLTTTPKQLTDGLEKLLSPLKVFRVPVHEISMMMSIALRFIPILMEETDKIMRAQMARGASFDQGNLVQRAKSLVPLLIPLFVSSFRRAGDLALAMEARCYHGGEGRTKMKPLVYGAGDRIAYAVLWGYLALMIVLRVLL